MRKTSIFSLGIVAAVLLASCAPKPEPILPEPVYDKYGNAVIEECRPSSQPVSPNYPERLPICQETCAPGTMPNPNATAARTLPQCVPIPPDEDNNRTPQRGQQN